MFGWLKKIYLKKCTQPGAKGIDFRKRMERGVRWFGWIPLVGGIIRKIAPTDAEIEAELARLGRRQRL